MKKAAIWMAASLLLANGASAAETEHLVAKGDTLYKLTKQYGVTLDQLKQWNGLNSDQVFIGQKLLIAPLGNQWEAPPAKPASSSSAPLDKLSPPPLNAAVNGDHVNFRIAGDIKSKIITTLRKGTKVQLVESGTLWSKVKLEDTIGFVATVFLDQNKMPVSSSFSSRSGDSLETHIQNVISPLLGIPYVSGGDSLVGFDCSGFTKYVMEQMGVSLPRVSEEQFSVGTPVERDHLQIGDLLFFDSYGIGKITHVAIYVGNNKIAHSATKAVEISDATWYFDHYPYYGAKRVIQ